MKKSKRSKKSNSWKIKQHRDPFFKRSKTLGYRSRASFKLIELNNKFKFIRKNINLLASNNELEKKIFVKVRSTGDLLEANVLLNENKTGTVNLTLPEDGISPGQACVFYNKDQFGYKVLGGGWIKE